MVLAPDFAPVAPYLVKLSEVGDDGKAGTAVGYGRLSDDPLKSDRLQHRLSPDAKLSTGNHFGGRLVFDGKGYLLLLGENNQRPDGAGSG